MSITPSTSLKSVLNVMDHSKDKDALHTNAEGTDSKQGGLVNGYCVRVLCR